MLPELRSAIHPGQILLTEFLEPLRLTPAELADSDQIKLFRAHRNPRIIRGPRHCLAVKQQTTPRVYGQTTRAGAHHRRNRLHANDRDVESHILPRLCHLHHR
jgi:hypothetical protein